MQKNYNIADPEWEWYIGKLYSKLINDFINYDVETVVELAPGFRHKIANALSNIEFTGTLYVIDSSKDVLDYVIEKYKEFIPNAKIITINCNFEEAIDKLPNNIDLFLTNHSIDDMIISEYSNIKYNLDINDESLNKNLLQMWSDLYNDNIKRKQISHHIYLLFKKLLDEKEVKYSIISQYKSNSYFLGKSSLIDEITCECFNRVKQLYDVNNKKIDNSLNYYPFGIDDKRYNGKYLIDNTQNSKNWIVGIGKQNIQ